MQIDTARTREQLRQTYRRVSFQHLEETAAPIATLEHVAAVLRREYLNDTRSIANTENIARTYDRLTTRKDGTS